MVNAFKRGARVAVPVENPQTMVHTLSTGDPGRAYQLLWDLIERHGGAMEAASDEEAFQATRVVAHMEGLSVEPATAVAFAGLFKLVRAGTIKPDDLVVLNCSGHTFPVETQILGDKYERQIDLSRAGRGPTLPEEGLLSALEQVEPGARQIVVIEDNPDAARLISRILQTRGNCEVQTANDGRSGLSLVRHVHPDLVITDVMMPDLDGFQVIDALKADEALRHIPVIVLTAKELTVQERVRLNGQIDSLLQKGTFLSEDLLQRIVEALN
jgi:threonine synthase